MQIFELHFNFKEEENRYFNCFSFEPQNSAEKPLGNLCMVGALENTTSQNAAFLEKIAKDIKKKYYGSLRKKPNKALAQSLKAGNDFLAEEVKKENVNWLGNLNFAVLSIKDFDFSFTITGDLKLLLLRAGKVSEISKGLDTKEIEPFPLKVFFRILSGKLIDGDVVISISKQLFDFLTGKKIIEKLSISGPLSEKKLREILNPKIFKEAEEKNISGVCLIADFSKKQPGVSLRTKEIFFEKAKNNLFLNAIERIKLFKLLKLKKIKLFLFAPKKKNAAPIKAKLGAKSFFKAFAKIPRLADFKKNTALIVALVVVLALGFTLFKKNEEIKKDKEFSYFKELQQKFSEAENAMGYSDDKKAENLLKEILQSISQLSVENSSMKSEIDSLREKSKEKLFLINKIEKIESPKVLADIDIKSLEFVPQTLLVSDSKMFLASPISSNLFVFDLRNKNGIVLKYSRNLDLSDDSSSFILFFSAPDKMVMIENEEFKESKIILPEEDASFDLLSSYASNIYFLDQKKNEVIKYLHSSDSKWDNPKLSFQPKEKAKWMAIDSYFWMLNENNNIDVYYKGNIEKTIKLDIFPEIKNIAKIKTKAGFPYLYLLEPVNNRLVVIDKNGKLVKQIQSDKFDNLKDFCVSSNGSTVWILNGEQIFEISI